MAGRTFSLRVGSGERESRGYTLEAPRRGRLRFQGFRVSTRFPFGLFLKSLTLDNTDEALVYPTLEAIQAPPDFGRSRNGGEQVTGPGGTGAQVAGLREYAPGDTARRIHWRASARRSALLVREVESEHEAEIEVHLRTAGTTAGEAFEKRVSWAASEVVAFLDAGTRVALRTDHDHLPAGLGAGHRARLLGFLAVVQPGGEAEVS